MSRDPPGSGKMFLFLNRDISTRANIADTAGAGARHHLMSVSGVRTEAWPQHGSAGLDIGLDSHIEFK